MAERRHTAATLSLQAGIPTKVLGDAIYDVDGLTYRGHLDRFWAEGAAPDAGLLADFVRAASGALKLHGLKEPEAIRGESAYLLESAEEFLAHVEEGLGTKNLVADAMLKLTGKSYYQNIGIDTVATIVNDLITTGALPISIAMHAAVGDSRWFENAARADERMRRRQSGETRYSE